MCCNILEQSIIFTFGYRLSVIVNRKSVFYVHLEKTENSTDKNVRFGTATHDSFYLKNPKTVQTQDFQYIDKKCNYFGLIISLVAVSVGHMPPPPGHLPLPPPAVRTFAPPPFTDPPTHREELQGWTLAPSLFLLIKNEDS